MKTDTNINQDSSTPIKISESEFERLAARSQNALHALSRAAERYLRDGDSEPVLDSISAMMKTCGDCHSQLPAGSVPKVWQGLKN